MRKTLSAVAAGIVILLAGSLPSPAQENGNTNVVPAGTTLTVRVGRDLSSKTSRPGEEFPATLVAPVRVEGRTVIPSGSEVEGTVLDAKKQGAFKGQAVLALQLVSVRVHGRTYSVSTETYAQTVKGKGKRTAGVIGGGAAAGAIIGAIAGGGKGAAIGAGAGAAGGTAVAGGTGGENVNLPAESVIDFRLAEHLTIRPR